ncbi:MAG: HEAT repeat domain-containing protein [Eubacteriales bacterium]|nr:HEAT repeat domain-containing protein [Eubacteriales bacterium]
MSKLEKIRKYVEKGKADKLIAITHEKDKEIRIAAIEGLGDLIGSEKALNTLVAMLDDQDADIRRAVVHALGKSEGSYVETQLQYCLSHEKNETVLETARESLTKVKNKR